MEILTSLDNNRIKKIAKLHDKKYRDIENKFLVEGEHLVKEALKSNCLLEVIMTEDCNFAYDGDITYVTYDVLKKLCVTKSPQKIVGVCKKLKEKELGNKIVILDEIQDPGNLGTIIRSCAAFGIDTIITSNDTVDIYNDKVVRASEGMIFKINILKGNIKDVILKLKNNSYTIYGTKVDGGNKINEVKYPDKFALIMGNEGNGVKDDILSLCDSYLYIPMSNDVESLNVGVATSIILYEMERLK